MKGRESNPTLRGLSVLTKVMNYLLTGMILQVVYQRGYGTLMGLVFGYLYCTRRDKMDQHSGRSRMKHGPWMKMIFLNLTSVGGLVFYPLQAKIERVRPVLFFSFSQPKFILQPANSSLDQNPKGKDSLPTIELQGRTVKFLGGFKGKSLQITVHLGLALFDPPNVTIPTYPLVN